MEIFRSTALIETEVKVKEVGGIVGAIDDVFLFLNA